MVVVKRNKPSLTLSLPRVRWVGPNILTSKAQTRAQNIFLKVNNILSQYRCVLRPPYSNAMSLLEESLSLGMKGLKSMLLILCSIWHWQLPESFFSYQPYLVKRCTTPSSIGWVLSHSEARLFLARLFLLSWFWFIWALISTSKMAFPLN